MISSVFMVSPPADRCISSHSPLQDFIGADCGCQAAAGAGARALVAFVVEEKVRSGPPVCPALRRFSLGIRASLGCSLQAVRSRSPCRRGKPSLSHDGTERDQQPTTRWWNRCSQYNLPQREAVIQPSKRQRRFDTTRLPVRSGTSSSLRLKPAGLDASRMS